MIRFTRLQEEHLETVMGWRIKPEVSQYMLTDVTYDLENQRRWFDSIKDSVTCRYWVISYQDTPIGLISLAAIDRVNLRCTAGYYIGETQYRQLGAMITPYLYNYVFQEMKFRKIYGEVLSGNKNILKIHEIHGFREVGTWRDHVLKNGVFHDVVLIELLAVVWLKQKKYGRYIAQFA
jgi:UDP-4-amino-4,6-dideoxy-N-acetyl-beta-L-altrosamine N-acetyltransferase